MASNVVSDNFETGSGGVPQLGGTGATTCKAWVNFKGTGTVAIRDSYNVSSIIDNGTGLYTVNFSVAMANVNYVSTSMGAWDSTSYIGLPVTRWQGGSRLTAKTTTSFGVTTVHTSAFSPYDTDETQLSVFGD